MAQSLIFTALIFVALSGPASAWNEPDSFAGVKFFTDVTRALPKCKEVVLPGGYVMKDHYDDKQGPCWADYYGGYRIHNPPLFYVVDVHMVERKLAYLECDFHWEIFPRIAAAFRERYGASTRTEQEIWTNRMGAKVSNPVSYWDGKTVSIMLRQHSSSFDRGEATYTTDLWRQYSAQKFKDETKKAAKGL